MPVKAIVQIEYPLLRRLTEIEYPKKVKISEGKHKIKINQTLPFRVKFLPGIISEYKPGNAPPIGIAIVGVNNYIL